MNGKSITHFMWRWQHIFRSNLDSGASTLQSIGAGVDPRGYLVRSQPMRRQPIRGALNPRPSRSGRQISPA